MLLIFYHRIFTDEERYLAFYDYMDSEVNYKKLKGVKQALRSYADFLRLHQKARPQAYELMRKNLASIKRLAVMRYAIFAFLPTILFWHRWYYFLLPVILVKIGFLLYKHYVEKRDVAFYAMLMQTMVLVEYEHQSKK